MDSWIEIAQTLCLDPVAAAALFKPNAPGCWELASLPALSERQLLKATGSYFAERVLIAVTALEVVAIDVGWASLLRRQRRSWRRDELVVQVVANRDGRISLPALVLRGRDQRSSVDLAPRDAGTSTAMVFDLLVGSLVRGSRNT